MTAPTTAASLDAPIIPAVIAAEAPVLTPAQVVAIAGRRYATKKFDPQRRIGADQWAALEQALVLSASSSGLQPWRFIVITDPALRQQLFPLARNQRQVLDASHVVVFAARSGLAAEDIDRFIARQAEVRGTPADALATQRARLVQNFVTQPRPGFDPFEWARRQTFIALGQFLTSAALLGIDTCPMEGFDPPAVDQLLGLPSHGYRSVALAPAGYRAADDANALAAKVRFRVNDVVWRS
jgi:nitroreductase